MYSIISDFVVRKKFRRESLACTGEIKRLRVCVSVFDSERERELEASPFTNGFVVYDSS